MERCLFTILLRVPSFRPHPIPIAYSVTGRQDSISHLSNWESIVNSMQWRGISQSVVLVFWLLKAVGPRPEARGDLRGDYEDDSVKQ